jgi:hypothetical protein
VVASATTLVGGVLGRRCLIGGGPVRWFSMSYGAILSAALAAVFVVYVAKDRRRPVVAAAAAAALAMPLLWNVILRVTGATSAFSHDLPFRPFPISWQDAGSGVFTLAGTAIALGLLATPQDTAARTARLALWTALAALLVDVYLY